MASAVTTLTAEHADRGVRLDRDERPGADRLAVPRRG
jgi:hypothetical protein